MTKMKLLLAGASMVLMANAANSWGATAFVDANIERILTINGDTYGGCMARLDSSLSSFGLDCRGNWVTFSCSGDFASRQDAKKNWEMIQMAYALDSGVRLSVDDSRTHNEYCFASRVVLVKE